VRGGSSSVVECEEQGVVFMQDALVEGEGPSNTSHAIALSEESYGKIDRNSELKDAETGVYAFGAPASAELESGLTFTNVNNQNRFNTDGAGFLNDGVNGEVLQKLPSVTELPSPDGLGTGDYQGLVTHHSPTQQFAAYSRAHQDWMHVGRYKRSEFTDSFAGGETKTFQLLGDSILTDNFTVEHTVQPANDPGNDHGYVIDAEFYDTSSDTYEVRITETENDGGGEAFIQAWVISNGPLP
jgi:hypothetical protein